MRVPLDIVIPIKGGQATKSRLAGILSVADRQALSMTMSRHVLSVALSVASVRSVIVVTSCAEIAGVADQFGAQILMDDRNAGTAAACSLAVDSIGPAADILFLNADLPFLNRESLEDMIGSADGAVIAPDRRKLGTNALFRPMAHPVPPCFGEKSFARHIAAATQMGARFTIFNAPETANDIDDPSDLAILGRWQGRNWLRTMERTC